LLRRPAKRGTPRNDTLFIKSVLDPKKRGWMHPSNWRGKWMKKNKGQNEAICSKIANLKSKMTSLSVVPAGTMAFIFVRIE
jgi:hypothetical protein